MEEKKDVLTTMTVSGMPKSLVELIDQMATTQGRSRSSQTALLLKEIVALKQSNASRGRRGR